MFPFYGGNIAETQVCWADSANTRRNIEQGVDNYTSPCGANPSTHLGLCADCWVEITGRPLAEASPFVPLAFVPFDNDEPLPY